MRNEKTQTDIIPVRTDRSTVVYANRGKIEECGGIEGYIKRFNESRRASRCDPKMLLEW
jgi:hypothetical protein